MGGTTIVNFFTGRRHIQLSSNALPAVALVAARGVSPVDPSHHLHVGVPELSSDELVRGAGADRTDRVEVS